MTTFPLGGFYRGRLIAPRVFSTTTEGGAASWVVPAGITEIIGKCWGAGGGAGWAGTTSISLGAPGGYAQARIAVTPGETLTIFVPTGGAGSNVTRAGGGGGSWAGIFRSTTCLLLAPGGGGGGATRDSFGGNGGKGGGTTGSAGQTGGSGGGGGGGTQTAGGAGGGGDGGNGTSGGKWYGGVSYSSQILGGRNGAEALLGAGAGYGGDSSTESDRARGGGGGAGWYGGGGGGRGGNSGNGGGGGGGGGSGYVTGADTILLAGSGIVAPNQDRDYISGRGTGGVYGTAAPNGGAGLVVILF